MSPQARLLAAVVALPVLLAGLYVSLLAVFFVAISAQHPDPDDVPGDPCCWSPDTWGDVVSGLGYALALAYIAVVLVTTAVVLAVAGVKARAPAIVRRHARVSRGLGAVAVALAGAIGMRWFVL